MNDPYAKLSIRYGSKVSGSKIFYLPTS